MSKDTSSLGDWCKWLENNFSPDIAIPLLPIIIRFDGNNFSKWTKGLNKPFDERLMGLMQDVTRFVVHETNATIGYTQSDEITIILYSPHRDLQIYHDGKKQKILSKLTSKLTLEFNKLKYKWYLEDWPDAIFDARLYQTPTLQDAAIQLLWRENDAIKNSISMVAQTHFSHKELHKKTGHEKKAMLKDIGIDWEDMHPNFKRGTYFKRLKKSIPFSTEEITRLPAKHEARSNPDLKVERWVVENIDMPVLSESDNLVELIF